MDGQALPHHKRPLPQPESSVQARERAKREHARGFSPVAFGKEVFKRFGEDHSPLVAGSLSFFTLTALVPILLVAFSIFGYFMESEAARQQVISFVVEFLPGTAASSDLVATLKETLASTLDSTAAGPIGLTAIAGLLGLIWTSSSLFRNMETAFMLIFDTKEKRGFIKSVLTSLITMFFIGLLLLATIFVTGAVQYIQSNNINVAGLGIDDIPFLMSLIGFLVPILLTFGMFFTVYKVVPNAKIESKAAAVGALFATVFFEIAKYGFGWYVSNFGSFNKVYGSLGFIVFLVTWIFYSYMILLLGSEVADVYSDAVLGEPAVEEHADNVKEKHPETA